METTTLVIISNIGFILWFYTGYKIGKRKERKDCNKLIEDGKIPHLKNTDTSINKEFYCDSIGGSNCKHFKEGYCQFEKWCTAKHPEN